MPCPLGWGSSPADTIKVARLATESGLFPVFEAEDGRVVSSARIRRQVPVADYLRLQARYAHPANSQWAKLEQHSNLRRRRGSDCRLPMHRKEALADLSRILCNA